MKRLIPILLLVFWLSPAGAFENIKRVAEGVYNGDTPVPIKVDASGRTIGVSDDESSGARVFKEQLDYETVAASQTDQVLGVTGAVGDNLRRLNCVVTTAATSQVQIKDGSGTAITVLPNNVAGGVGTYELTFGTPSTGGAWKLTTAAGVACMAMGEFTP